MENVGKEPGINHGSLHGPSSTNATSDVTATITLPPGQKLSDNFHVYAAEWEPGTVRFYLDANLYATFTSAQWPAGGAWVFDHPFFLILNVAVGGDWPGSPDGTTAFPQTMLVDYVRVYKRKTRRGRTPVLPYSVGLRNPALCIPLDSRATLLCCTCDLYPENYPGAKCTVQVEW